MQTSTAGRRRLLQGLALGALAGPGRVLCAGSPWISPSGPPRALQPEPGDVNAACLSADGQTLVADTEQSLSRFDLATGKAAQPPFKSHRNPDALAVPLANGTQVLAALWGPSPGSGQLVLVDAANRKTRVLAALTREPSLMAATPDGSRVAIAYADQQVQVFDGNGRSVMAATKLVVGESVAGTRLDRVTALAISADGSRLAVGGEDVSLVLAEIGGSRPPRRVKPAAFKGVSWVHGPAQILAFSPDGTRLVSLEQGNNLALLDGVTGQALSEPVQVRQKVVALVMAPPAGRLWLLSAEGQIQLWHWDPA